MRAAAALALLAGAHAFAPHARAGSRASRILGGGPRARGLAMDVNADDTVCLRPYFEVANMDAFLEACDLGVSLTKSERDVVHYGFSAMDDKVHCRESYMVAEGVPLHLENAGKCLDGLLANAKLYNLELHGTEADCAALKEPLKALPVSYFSRVAGFRTYEPTPGPHESFSQDTVVSVATYYTVPEGKEAAAVAAAEKMAEAAKGDKGVVAFSFFMKEDKSVLFHRADFKTAAGWWLLNQMMTSLVDGSAMTLEKCEVHGPAAQVQEAKALTGDTCEYWTMQESAFRA